MIGINTIGRTGVFGIPGSNAAVLHGQRAAFSAVNAVNTVAAGLLGINGTVFHSQSTIDEKTIPRIFGLIDGNRAVLHSQGTST